MSDGTTASFGGAHMLSLPDTLKVALNAAAPGERAGVKYALQILVDAGKKAEAVLSAKAREELRRELKAIDAKIAGSRDYSAVTLLDADSVGEASQAPANLVAEGKGEDIKKTLELTAEAGRRAQDILSAALAAQVGEELATEFRAIDEQTRADIVAELRRELNAIDEEWKSDIILAARRTLRNELKALDAKWTPVIELRKELNAIDEEWEPKIEHDACVLRAREGFIAAAEKVNQVLRAFIEFGAMPDQSVSNAELMRTIAAYDADVAHTAEALVRAAKKVDQMSRELRKLSAASTQSTSTNVVAAVTGASMGSSACTALTDVATAPAVTAPSAAPSL